MASPDSLPDPSCHPAGIVESVFPIDFEANAFYFCGLTTGLLSDHDGCDPAIDATFVLNELVTADPRQSSFERKAAIEILQIEDRQKSPTCRAQNGA